MKRTFKIKSQITFLTITITMNFFLNYNRANLFASATKANEQMQKQTFSLELFQWATGYLAEVMHEIITQTN